MSWKWGPAIALTLCLGACKQENIMYSFEKDQRSWVLNTLDGKPFEDRAYFQFDKSGRIIGEGPCNRFSGSQTGDYPMFSAGPLAATKRACPALAAESAFFEALQAMTQARNDGNTLTLSNAAGREMIFISGT